MKSAFRSSAVLYCLALTLLPLTASAKFLSVDPKANKYPDISPYVYALNNPLRFIDPNGLAAWEVKADWDNEMQKKYQGYATQQAEAYQKSGKDFTCEDFPLTILIDFASANGLPLTITNGSGSYNVTSDQFSNVADFKNAVLPSTAASDLQRGENTVSTTLSSLHPGDLILKTSNAGVATHTQLVTSVAQGSIGVHQGNFGFLGNLGLGSANPSAFNYAGTGVQEGRYILDAKSGHYDYSRGAERATRNAFAAFNAQFRGWNFGQWKR